jgi:uncharacterized protein (TIGR02246 family)
MNCSLKHLLVPLVAGLFLAGCAPRTEPVPAKPATAGSADMAKVRESSEARMKAVTAGDTEGYLAAYLDDAVWMPPDSEDIIGKAAARQRLTGVMADMQVEFKTESKEQVAMGADWIADRGTYILSATSKKDESSRQDVGSYLTIWQRQSDGSWKIAYDSWHSVRPPAEPAKSR